MKTELKNGGLINYVRTFFRVIFITISGIIKSKFVRVAIGDAIKHRLMREKINYRQFLAQMNIVILKGERLDAISWFVDENTGIAYFRNAKVACSSFIPMIKKLNIANGDFVHENLEDEEIRGELEGEDKYFKFTFVRNPFVRLFSCYTNKVNIKTRKGHLYKELWLGYLKEDEGFKRFVEKVCCIPDEWSDRHFVSQYYQLYKEGKCRCDYVGKLEELPEAFEDIRKKFNLGELQKHNVSNTHDWMDHYDLEMVEMVYERYKKDFQYFGYEEDYLNLKEYVKNKVGN